jgi:hypothetical protein
VSNASSGRAEDSFCSHQISAFIVTASAGQIIVTMSA